MHQQITSDIFQVAGGGLTSPEDAAAYLITSGNHAALIDAGCGYAMNRMLENIENCGVSPEQVEALLLTHCHFDHTGGAKAFRDKTGCRIIVHEADAVFLETGDNEVTAASWYGSVITGFKADHLIRGDRETIQLGDKSIEAVHTPGHSPGSAVYLTESGGMTVLFGQDVHGPLDRRLLSDRGEYEKSLLRMIDMRADILCEGHFGVFKGKDRVERFIRRFL